MTMVCSTLTCDLPAPDNELSPIDGAGGAAPSPTLTEGNNGEFISCKTGFRIYLYLNFML